MKRSLFHLWKTKHLLSALCEADLQKITKTSIFTRSYVTSKHPVVIGGSNVDIVVTPTEDIIMDGRMLNGTIAQCHGGVARNIADALARLHVNPMLITAVGDDGMGKFLMEGSKHMNTRGYLHCSNHSSACCCIVVDKDRECKILVGNMDIHAQITIDWIQKFETYIANSNFIVLDGNVKPECFNYVLQLSKANNIPVWFEPTDIAVCDVIFQSSQWKAITHMSPNFNELCQMSSTIAGQDYSNLKPNSLEETITQSIKLAAHFPKTMLLMVTLGKHGMLFVHGNNIKYYEALPVENINNVSGAGDCAVAGFIVASLHNMSEIDTVSAALSCAKQSLFSTTPVPSQMSLNVVDIKHRSLKAD